MKRTPFKRWRVVVRHSRGTLRTTEIATSASVAVVATLAYARALGLSMEGAKAKATRLPGAAA